MPVDVLDAVDNLGADLETGRPVADMPPVVERRDRDAVQFAQLFFVQNRSLTLSLSLSILEILSLILDRHACNCSSSLDASQHGA